MKKLLVLVPALALVFGCGGEPADETAEPAENAEPVAETVELSETIVLPEGWEMIDAVSVEEIEEIVGADGYDTWHEPLSDAAGGKPQKGSPDPEARSTSWSTPSTGEATTTGCWVT